MGRLNSLLKIAKDIAVKPGENLEDKIIERINSLKDEEKDSLDKDFLEFLKKENSRLYLFGKKVRENSGLVVFFSLLTAALTAFLIIEYKNYKRKK